MIGKRYLLVSIEKCISRRFYRNISNMPINDEKSKCANDKGNGQKSKKEANVNIKPQLKNYDSFSPDIKGDIKVCMIGGGESLMYAAVLLKQFRLIKRIHVVDTKDSLANAILDISHIDTSPRVKYFKRKHLKEALKEVCIYLLKNETNEQYVPNITLTQR